MSNPGLVRVSQKTKARVLLELGARRGKLTVYAGLMVNGIEQPGPRQRVVLELDPRVAESTWFAWRLTKVLTFASRDEGSATVRFFYKSTGADYFADYIYFQHVPIGGTTVLSPA